MDRWQLNFLGLGPGGKSRYRDAPNLSRHVYSTKSFVIPVVLFSLLYNVPKFFELRTEWVTINATTNATINATR